jgi:Bacterial Ig-like domain (group 2)
VCINVAGQSTHGELCSVDAGKYIVTYPAAVESEFTMKKLLVLLSALLGFAAPAYATNYPIPAASSPWTATGSGAPTLVSAYLGSTGSANTMVAGGTLQFAATGIYSDGSSATIANAAIIWSSDNRAVLNIASSGLASAAAAGVANVNAKIGTVSSSPWTVTVSGARTLVSAYLGSTGSANTMVAGKALQFTATGIYSDGSSATIANPAIIWLSDNPAVINIATSGLATGVAAGVANVGAKIGTVSSSSWTVTVSGARTLVSAYLGSTGSANTMVAGKTLQFTATGIYSDGSSATVANAAIIWSSGNPAVLNIASSGLASAAAAGVANVSAKIGTVSSSPWTVTVSGARTLVSAYLRSKGNANTLVVGQTLQFTAYGTYSDGSVGTLPDSQGDTVTGWNTSNPSVAKVSSGGNASATGAGTVNVGATIGGLQAIPWTMTVSKASGPLSPTTVTWNALSAIKYGAALSSVQLDATASVPGSFIYKPAAGTVLKAGTQTLSVVFTPADTQTYSTATATVPLTITQAASVAAWAPLASMQQGTPLGAAQLDATASVPGGFTYNPDAGTVPQVGTLQLTATFTPTDATDYSPTTVHNSLVIIPSTIGPGTNCALTPGASISTIQGAINAAATGSCAVQTVDSILLDGRTVLFTAGAYTISSQISIPCPSSSSTPLVIEGPPPAGVGTTWPITPTAVLTSTLTNNWAFDGSACGVGTTFRYLQYNGGNPSGGGGGFLFVAPGMNNLTVINNWFYGNNAIAAATQEADSVIWLDGSPMLGSTRTQNTLITWNRFGKLGSADCGILMNTLGGNGYPYQGNASEKDDGGYCNATGVHVNVDNFTFSNNAIQTQEQGIKFFEGVTYPNPNVYQPTNINVIANDFAGIHRIGLETQQGAPGPTNVISNVYRDAILPDGVTWALSQPGGGPQNISSNILIQDVIGGTDRFGIPASRSYAVEFWATNGTVSNNLIQGYWGGAVAWGYSSKPWSIANNTMQSFTNLFENYISDEEGTGQPPTIIGNVTTHTVSSAISVAPTISPSSGQQTIPLTVTLADPGYTTGPVPQGNTGIWYTIDGTTPVPGAGTAKYLSTGQTFILAGPATVKAVGMWGALNQPTSYPSGYGFVPSSVVTASYATASIVRPAAAARISSSNGEAATAPAAANSPAKSGVVAPALESVAIVPSQPDVAIGSATQLKAIATFDDGSTKDVTADFAWTSSDPRTVATSSSGVLAGLASGKALISGSYQSHQASVAASSALGDIQWSGPIVITRGGTYSGNWQSNDPRTPAVTVSTTEPVIVENSHIRSVSGLIKAETSGSDLIVRNNVAVAANAAAKGQPNGIFLQAASPARLDVENNYIENASSGVVVHGYSGNRDGKQTIVIRANRARNLSGLLSDGNGGYLPGEGLSHSVSRFIELDTVQAVPGMDVGWNEVVNYPGRSLVSDNIDVNRSSGTPNQPLEIHDTYIQGAYPYRAAQDAYNGGGIKTEGGSNDSPQEAAAFSSIHDNQVVGTVGYGIAFTAGHDNIASNNRVISSGLLADGTRIAAQGAGLVEDATGGANASVYNNTMRDNLVGWMCWKSSCAQGGYRNDVLFPASPADYSTNSAFATGEITFNTENNEYQIWLNKMVEAAVTVGPTF